MAAVKTRVFRSGNSEAVRLPREVAYGRDIDVTVERVGDVVTIRPVVDAAAAKQELLDLLADLQALPRPSYVEVRKPIEFPERPGL